MASEQKERSGRAAINFTKAAIENLPASTAGWKYYYDTKVSGLAIGVGPSGIKTFVLYRMRKHRENSRDRFLQPDELPKFFEQVLEYPNATIRDYILLSLFTGARRANVLEMSWDELHLERAEWRIPETKNGTPQTVPLVPDAVEILRMRKTLPECADSRSSHGRSSQKA